MFLHVIEGALHNVGTIELPHDLRFAECLLTLLLSFEYPHRDLMRSTRQRKGMHVELDFRKASPLRGEGWAKPVGAIIFRP